MRQVFRHAVQQCVHHGCFAESVGTGQSDMVLLSDAEFWYGDAWHPWFFTTHPWIMCDLPLMSVGMQYGLCWRSRGIVRAGHPAAAEYDNTFREMQELLSVAWPYVGSRCRRRSVWPLRLVNLVCAVLVQDACSFVGMRRPKRYRSVFRSICGDRGRCDLCGRFSTRCVCEHMRFAWLDVAVLVRTAVV